MSIRHVSAVLDHMPELDRLEAFVLIAVADSADKDSGVGWPSLRTIAGRARCTPRGARKALRRLEAAGYIERQDNVGRSSQFRVLFDTHGERRAAAALYASKRRGAEPRSGGAEPRSGGAEPRSGGGGTVFPPYMRTVIEPSSNPRASDRRRGLKKMPEPDAPRDLSGEKARQLEQLRAKQEQQNGPRP